MCVSRENEKKEKFFYCCPKNNIMWGSNSNAKNERKIDPQHKFVVRN